MSLSLFIPRVFTKYTQDYIIDAFQNEVGDVDHVDVILKQDTYGHMYNTVYVHFANWFNSPTAKQIKAEIASQNSSRFYHGDGEAYWIVLENKTKKQATMGNRRIRLDIVDHDKASETIYNLNENFYETMVSESAAVEEFTYEEYAELQDEIDMIDELNDLAEETEEESSHHILIDGRYVSIIEQENIWMGGYIQYLSRLLFCKETNEVDAADELIQKNELDCKLMNQLTTPLSSPEWSSVSPYC